MNDSSKQKCECVIWLTIHHIFFTTMITFSSEEEGVALKKAIEVHKSLMANVSPKAVVLGPTAKSIARMNNRYYFQIIVKYKK